MTVANAVVRRPTPYVIYTCGRTNTPVVTDQQLDPLGGSITTYLVFPLRASSIVGIVASISLSPTDNLDVTYTIDVLVNGIKVAQATDTKPRLVATTTRATFAPGTHKVAITDYIQVMLTTSGDINGNSDIIIQIWVQDD